MTKEVKVEKATYEDKHSLLSKAVSSKLNKENAWEEYYWLTDFDDQYVFVCEGGSCYRISYTMSDVGDVTLMDDKVKVNRTTEYVVSEETEESKVEKTLLNVLTKYFGGSSKQAPSPVIKQFCDDEMIAVEPLYCPPEMADGHDEGMTETEIRKMVESMNSAIEKGVLKANLFHKETTDKFSVLRGWVNECDCYIGEHLVVKGQPIAEIKFHDEALWKERKAGNLMGLSIGARAKNKRPA